MNTFSFYRNKSNFIFIFLLTFSLISMIFNLQSMRHIIIPVVDTIKWPFFMATNYVSDFFSDTISTFVRLDEWEQQLAQKEKLLEELEHNAGTIEALERRIQLLESQNRMIRELDRRRYGTDIAEPWGESVTAEIISYGGASYFDSLYINKGSIDGIKPGMPVIAYQNGKTAAVGKVYEVSPYFSIIIPIYHPSCRIGVLNQYSRDHFILEGLGVANRTALLKYIDRQADIEVDDTIITFSDENQNTIFPRGILVGTIKEIRENRMDRSKTAIVEPYIDFSKLEIIYILKRELPEDLRELIEIQNQNK